MLQNCYRNHDYDKNMTNLLDWHWFEEGLASM